MTRPHAPEVWHYLSSREYLLAFDHWASKSLRGYSHRALAKWAKIASPNFFGLVLSGKRSFSSKWVKGFARAAKLSTEAQSYLENLVAFENSPSSEQRDSFEKLLQCARQSKISSLAGDQLRLVQNPLAWTIYHMLDLPDQVTIPTWFKKRLILPVTTEDIRMALKLLKDLALVEQLDADQKLKSLKKNIESPSQIQKMENLCFHHFVLAEANEILDVVNTEERSFGSLTVTLNEEQAQELREEIQSFGKKLLTKYTLNSSVSSATKQTKVPSENLFRMNIQFYPLTQVNNKGNKT